LPSGVGRRAGLGAETRQSAGRSIQNLAPLPASAKASISEAQFKTALLVADRDRIVSVTPDAVLVVPAAVASRSAAPPIKGKPPLSPG
jgi:hypothetical protein